MKQSTPWGWFEHNGSNTYRFDPGKNINDFNKITKPTNNLLIKLGNDFGDGWIKHTDIPHNNWFFWDNPELPHLLYTNIANPLGLKDWIRLVPHAILTKTKLGSGTDRINRLLSEQCGRRIEWQDIATPQDVLWNNSRKVLLCPSSANCYTYYYGITKEHWIEETTQKLESLGYIVELRNKPSRTLRKKDPKWRLQTQLEQGDYAFTVSQHSVAAMETILAGVPSVVTGPHPCGDLATPWHEMEQGEFRLPRQADVEDWVDGLLYNTRHKREMREGTWREL